MSSLIDRECTVLEDFFYLTVWRMNADSFPRFWRYINLFVCMYVIYQLQQLPLLLLLLLLLLPQKHQPYPVAYFHLFFIHSQMKLIILFRTE